MQELPKHLKHALHVASTIDDDDEYWAVKRPDGKWDLYTAFSLGGRYPNEPYATVEELPKKFINRE